MAEKKSRTGWIWPLLGVLSVLVPVLIVAGVVWRSSVSDKQAASRSISSATPSELALIYLEAVSDDDHKLVREALDPELDQTSTAYRGLTDPGLRGLFDEKAAEERVGDDSAEVDVSFRTARPLEDGREPQLVDGTIKLVRKDGRWYVAQLEIGD